MFSRVRESDITRAIISEFSDVLKDHIESDVIVVGAGPSGLMAARDLAKAGYKTLLIESNNYLGGGFWIGGYLMNTLTFRNPSQKILNELSIPYKEFQEGLFTVQGPYACSTLIAATCKEGVAVLNMTKVDDVVYRNNKVEGVVVNWTPVGALPRAITCVDPVALEAKIVIDATGHDAHVLGALTKRNILSINQYGPMDVVSSEEGVVEKTSLIHPGLIVTGMAAATAYGITRMGPTFGAMLCSGRKAAAAAVQLLKETKNVIGANREVTAGA